MKKSQSSNIWGQREYILDEDLSITFMFMSDASHKI
jgi:hypothetical protein